MTQKAIKEMYRAFRAEYKNRKPNRALVQMYWEDETPEDLRVDTIALTPVPFDDDDEILFYASGLKGLLDLTKPNNGSDFVVTKVLQFYREK